VTLRKYLVLVAMVVFGSLGDLLLVRFHGNVVPVTVMLKSIVHDLDPQMLVVPSTLRAQIDENAENGWLIGKMLLFVAAVAVALALLGIYGMVGYSVTRRTREFGIRAAVGATPRDVMRVVFVTGSRPVIAGIVIGSSRDQPGAQDLPKARLAWPDDLTGAVLRQFAIRRQLCGSHPGASLASASNAVQSASCARPGSTNASTAASGVRAAPSASAAPPCTKAPRFWTATRGFFSGPETVIGARSARVRLRTGK